MSQARSLLRLPWEHGEEGEKDVEDDEEEEDDDEDDDGDDGDRLIAYSSLLRLTWAAL